MTPSPSPPAKVRRGKRVSPRHVSDWARYHRLAPLDDAHWPSNRAAQVGAASEWPAPPLSPAQEGRASRSLGTLPLLQGRLVGHLVQPPSPFPASFCLPLRRSECHCTLPCDGRSRFPTLASRVTLGLEPTPLLALVPLSGWKCGGRAGAAAGVALGHTQRELLHQNQQAGRKDPGQMELSGRRLSSFFANAPRRVTTYLETQEQQSTLRPLFPGGPARIATVRWR